MHRLEAVVPPAGNFFGSWSAAGQSAVAAFTAQNNTSTSKTAESEPTEGKLMGKINIDWNYVQAKPEASQSNQGDMSDDEKLKQTKKVLEEEVSSCTSDLVCSKFGLWHDVDQQSTQCRGFRLSNAFCEHCDCCGNGSS